MAQTPMPGPRVSVIPKTSAQQTRSAWYTWTMTAGLAVPGLCILAGKLIPAFHVYYPVIKDTVTAICHVVAALGGAMLASQRQQSAKTETEVNLS